MAQGCEIFDAIGAYCHFGESRVLLRLAHGLQKVAQWANGLCDRVETLIWMNENENV
jgi:hypothetical protein